MTVQELIEALNWLPPDKLVQDDYGRSVMRVKEDGTLMMDRSEDE